MPTVYSVNGVPIRLTEERWRHVVVEHPEMGSHRERVMEALRDPELIQEGDLGEFIASRFYEEIEARGKYVFVVYREISAHDGFIITAYTNEERSKRKEVIWSRP